MATSASAAQSTARDARYLPSTISAGRTGTVRSSSKVPERRSSATSRMERNGVVTTRSSPTEPRRRATTVSVRFNLSSTLEPPGISPARVARSRKPSSAPAKTWAEKKATTTSTTQATGVVK
jgi:hypothetical protein